MESRGRGGPFAAVGAIVGILSLALFRLPESFVNQIENDRPLSGPQSDWAYRLLFLAALGQALYGGFVTLHPERLEKARKKDPKTRAMSRERLLTSVARTAAGMIALTLVYSLAAFAITRQRGGYWLFLVLIVAQMAWYLRQVRVVGSWLAYQPANVNPLEDGPDASWNAAPPDYIPPIARGLEPTSDSQSTSG